MTGATNLHQANRIHELLRAAPSGLSANALSRAAGLEVEEVYAGLVSLYDRHMARPEITFYPHHQPVATWIALQ